MLRRIALKRRRRWGKKEENYIHSVIKSAERKDVFEKSSNKKNANYVQRTILVHDGILAKMYLKGNNPLRTPDNASESYILKLIAFID